MKQAQIAKLVEEDLSRNKSIMVLGDFINSGMPGATEVSSKLETSLKLRGLAGASFDDVYTALNALSDEELEAIYAEGLKGGMQDLAKNESVLTESASQAWADFTNKLNSKLGTSMEPGEVRFFFVSGEEAGVYEGALVNHLREMGFDLSDPDQIGQDDVKNIFLAVGASEQEAEDLLDTLDINMTEDSAAGSHTNSGQHMKDYSDESQWDHDLQMHWPDAEIENQGHVGMPDMAKAILPNGNVVGFFDYKYNQGKVKVFESKQSLTEVAVGSVVTVKEQGKPGVRSGTITWLDEVSAEAKDGNGTVFEFSINDIVDVKTEATNDLDGEMIPLTDLEDDLLPEDIQAIAGLLGVEAGLVMIGNTSNTSLLNDLADSPAAEVVTSVEGADGTLTLRKIGNVQFVTTADGYGLAIPAAQVAQVPWDQISQPAQRNEGIGALAKDVAGQALKGAANVLAAPVAGEIGDAAERAKKVWSSSKNESGGSYSAGLQRFANTYPAEKNNVKLVQQYVNQVNGGADEDEAFDNVFAAYDQKAKTALRKKMAYFGLIS